MTRHSSSNNRATLQDVALKSGVSASTVSAVLAGKHQNRRISDETRKRVEAAAELLSYSPNLLHRSMRQGRTNIVSLFNSFRARKRGDLYLDRLFGAIEESSGELGYDVLVHTDFSRSVEDTFDFLNGRFSDGLILFGSTEKEPLLPLLRRANLPTVLIGPRHPEPDFINVVNDEALGMSLVADALVSNGHREIAAVADMGAGIFDATGRVERLRSELVRHGVTLRSENVTAFDHSDHADIARWFLNLNPRPTALFVWHDANAYHILDALEAQGMSIPNDVSVVAYDGIVWPARSAHRIASVVVPMEEIASTGVRLLARSIDEGRLTPQTLTISVQFDPGTTLGPALSNAGKS